MGQEQGERGWDAMAMKGEDREAGSLERADVGAEREMIG
jgi:hypothetical protein